MTASALKPCLFISISWHGNYY